MKRILFAIPIPFGPNWGFWTRDSGLVVLELRKMGVDAWLVALGDSTTLTEGQPALPITRAEMEDPAWWKAQKPDAVVLSTWSAPRYDAIRKAALAATPCVVERLDTSGNRSCRLFPRPCFIQSWGGYWDKFPPYAKWLAWVPAAARTALFYSFPQLLDKKMAVTMKQLPGAIAESPIATERMQKMFETFTGSRQRMEMIPHPVNDSILYYDDTPKENVIITVGRWASAQKDYPLLKKVLRDFLERHADWKAIVVGKGVPEADRNAGAGTEEWHRRIAFHESLAHEQLVPEYRRAKIYLMVSRYESFCIAAAEALCCGGSVVGSADVPTSYYFAQSESGMVSPVRDLRSFSTTLDAEVKHWEAGDRNPKAISAYARREMGSQVVAKATLTFLENVLPAGGPAS